MVTVVPQMNMMHDPLRVVQPQAWAPMQQIYHGDVYQDHLNRAACGGGIAINPVGRSVEAKTVCVIGPGAGLMANEKVYAQLKRDSRFLVKPLRLPTEHYDRYPEHWDGGVGPPNLESFAEELLGSGVTGTADCLVAGSRGGQVVLPRLWRTLAMNSPPAVVINGGCAMRMPGPAVQWPRNAVTLMVIGGKDYFRAKMGATEYIENTRSFVPAGNTTSAFIFIREMKHMPQPTLLKQLLGPLILAAIQWKSSGQAPLPELEAICKELQSSGWNGSLNCIQPSGDWLEKPFGPAGGSLLLGGPAGMEAPMMKLQSSTTPEKVMQEEQHVAELEALVRDQEERLHLLRCQLKDAKEKARRLRMKAGMAVESSGKFSKGQRVKYWSVSQGIWVDTEIVHVRPRDEAVQVSVKPDHWITIDEQAAKIRVS